MTDAATIDNAAVIKALADVTKGFEALKADIDTLKKPRGRTDTDVIDRDRIDRTNKDVGDAQAVIDKARRARVAAKETLDRIVAARGDRPAPSGRVRRSGAVIRILNHLTGKPLAQDEIDARIEYREKFLAWTRDANPADIIRLAPKAAMQTQIGEKGGFLVPFEMESAVIQLGGLYSAMRSLADVRPISQGNSLKQPANLQGSSFGWTTENASRTETTTDDIGMLEWFLMECYASPKVTNLLLQDAAFDVESWLTEGISREMAEGEGLAFISGTGISQPRGIQNYTKVANASWTWGNVGYIASGVAATITDSTHNGYDAFIDMITALHRRYLPNANFMMNRVVQATIRKVKDANSNYMWQPSVTADKPATILGYPVETDDNLPNESAGVYPVMFGDYKQAYRIVDKPGMAMLRDELTDKGRTIFYTTRRTGGGMKNFEAVKFLKVATS